MARHCTPLSRPLTGFVGLRCIHVTGRPAVSALAYVHSRSNWIDAPSAMILAGVRKRCWALACSASINNRSSRATLSRPSVAEALPVSVAVGSWVGSDAKTCTGSLRTTVPVEPLSSIPFRLSWSSTSPYMSFDKLIASSWRASCILVCSVDNACKTIGVSRQKKNIKDTPDVSWPVYVWRKPVPPGCHTSQLQTLAPRHTPWVSVELDRPWP